MSPFLSKQNQTTKAWSSAHSYFWSFFQWPEERPYTKTNFSFTRCITGSMSSSPECQSSISIDPSMRINSQSPAWPLPGPWWRNKAGIQNHINGSSPCAPHSCLPFPSRLFLSVRERITARTACVKDPLPGKGKQGTGSKSQRNCVRSKKGLNSTMRGQLTWQGLEGLKKITPTWMLPTTQQLLLTALDQAFPLKPGDFHSH